MSLSDRFDHIATIDFETYYAPDFTLSKLTTEAYVRDPRFEEIGVGVAVDHAEPVWFHPHAFGTILLTLQDEWPRTAVLHHHAHFDGAILAWHHGVKPAFWLDTLSMARALHGTEVGGSLSKLARHYQLGEKGDEVVKALGKRLADFTPDEWQRYGDYCKQDVKLTRALFWRLLQGGFPEGELHHIDTTVRMFTEPTFCLDVPLMSKTLDTERVRKAELLARVAQDPTTLQSNDRFADLLVRMGETPPTKESPRTGKTTWAFAKTDPGMQDLLEHERDDIRWLAEARVGVKSTITETRTERLLGIAQRGRVPIYLKYAGAHTFRWSGGDKMNAQNFNRGGDIRQALRAPEGHVLVVADSAQIEARVLACLAGESPVVEAFRQGRDIYSEDASQVYGRPITKADKLERFVGKVMRLGLGYGMGWRKAAETFLKGALGGSPVTFGPDMAEMLGVDVGGFRAKHAKKLEDIPSRLGAEALAIHCAVAERIVRTYRQTNAAIVALWEQMEEVLSYIAPEEVEEAPLKAGMAAVRHGIRLPNGLVMRYPGLRLRETADGGGYSYLGGKSGKESVKIYGGLLTENVVQALARIIVADQMQACRDAGLHIVTMTHDEVVACVPAGDGAAALELMLRLMRVSPSWAPDLPLNAEGGVGETYGAAK